MVSKATKRRRAATVAGIELVLALLHRELDNFVSVELLDEITRNELDRSGVDLTYKQVLNAIKPIGRQLEKRQRRLKNAGEHGIRKGW